MPLCRLISQQSTFFDIDLMQSLSLLVVFLQQKEIIARFKSRSGLDGDQPAGLKNIIGAFSLGTKQIKKT